MKTERGTIKRVIGEVEIKGYELSPIIIEALMGENHELISEAIFNNSQQPVGEKITVYKIQKM